MPKLLKKQQQRAVLAFQRAWDEFNINAVRNRLLCIDKEMAREALETITDDRLEQTSMKPVQVPIIQPQVDTFHSELLSIYMPSSPLLSVSAGPENAGVQQQINALLKESEKLGNWVPEFVLWLRDSVKYNYHALQCVFDTEYSPVYANPLPGSNNGAASVSFTKRQFSKLTRCSPYNVIFDPYVRPAEVASKGEYAGYVELISRVELLKFMAKLDSRHVINKQEALNCSEWYTPDLFYLPQVTDITSVKNAPGYFDWNTFFDLAPNVQKQRRAYALVTTYWRATPNDLELNPSKQFTGDGDLPRVWKIIYVNGMIPIYFEELTNAHQMFEMVVGQPADEGIGLQSKTFVENLQPIQKLVTQLHTARIADLARALADRGLYDPFLISSKTINDPNPSAKMPVLPSAYNKKKLQDAYYPIPYRNESAPYLLQEAQLVSKYGEDIGGLNPVQRGSFVKGNKTLGEFQEIMGNAKNRIYVVALMIDAQSFSPIKEMIKSNILQYQVGTEVYDSETKQKVTVDPTTIRQVQFDFDMADGLKPVSSFRDPNVMGAALQFIASSPQLQQEYDLTSFFAHMFNVRGLTDLGSFRRAQPFVQQTAQPVQQPAQ